MAGYSIQNGPTPSLTCSPGTYSCSEQHWQRPSSGFPISFLDYVGNARINGCGDAILFLPKVESNHGIRDGAPDPLTHFADTRRRRRPLVAHFGATAKSRHWAPNGLASSHPTMMRKAQNLMNRSQVNYLVLSKLSSKNQNLCQMCHCEHKPRAEAWSRATGKSLFSCSVQATEESVVCVIYSRYGNGGQARRE